MNHPPLVSVIIIFLNGEPFIEEAIASVFAQTYEHWELLLVDDGSTDGSTAIAKRYAQEHSEKVRYLEHENHQNLGMSASRNLGIFNSQGCYIALLDADDVWMPMKLEQQVEILESNPEVAMIYGLSKIWYSWTGKPKDQSLDFVSSLGFPSSTIIQPPKFITHCLQNENLAPTPSSIMFRSVAAKAVGGFEANFRNFYEDMAFYCKIALKASIFAADQPWHLYRQHSNNYSKICIKDGTWHPNEPNSVSFALLSWLEQYLIHQEATDEELWQALRSQLFPYRHPVLYSLRKQVWRFLERGTALITLIPRLLLPPSIRHWLKNQRSSANP